MKIRVFTAILCLLLILSFVLLPANETAVAQVSTNGMAYAQVNKSGCCVRKGNCQIRLDFYLEPGDVRYYDKYLYLVDTTSPEYLAGYPGKVDEFGNPIDQAEWGKWWDALPRVWVNTPFHTHFVYLPPDFTEEDIKAQIDIHLGNFYQAFQDGWDAVAGGMRHGWATDTRIRPTDYSKIETPAEYDARAVACQDAVDVLIEFQYKPDGEISGETFPATEIDIGADATDRGYNAYLYLSGPRTVVGKDNPANDTGAIDSYEIWLLSSNSPDIWLGTFSASENVLTCRDSESIGNIAAGSKQSGSGLDIEVSSGDYFGACAKTASGTTQIEADGVGGSDLWVYAGECIDPSDSQTFAVLADDIMSLYGTGETAGGCSPSYTISPSSWVVNGGGSVYPSSQYTSGFGYFNVTNNYSGGNIDISISASNMTGGGYTWLISDTATPGSMQYGMKASTDNETLYESCTSNNDYYFIIGEEMFGQTFTPSTNHTITSAQMLMFRDNGPIGDVIISLWATNGTIPTGSALTTYTFDGDTLTTSDTGEWVEATFGTTVTVTAGTTYAIVAQAPESTSYYLNILENLFGNPYAGGASVYADSEEDPWIVYSATTDVNFKEYGGDFDIIVKGTGSTPYDTLVSGLSEGSSQLFELLFYSPTVYNDYNLKTGYITLTVVCS